MSTLFWIFKLRYLCRHFLSLSENVKYTWHNLFCTIPESKTTKCDKLEVYNKLLIVPFFWCSCWYYAILVRLFNCLVSTIFLLPRQHRHTVTRLKCNNILSTTWQLEFRKKENLAIHIKLIWILLGFGLFKSSFNCYLLILAVQFVVHDL